MAGQPRPLGQMAAAGVRVAGVSALCRLASLAKELYVAFILGAGVATDAYSLLMLLPAMVTALLVHAVRSAFLAQYPPVSRDGEQAGQRFANHFMRQLVVASLLMAAAATVILWIVWPYILPHAAEELARISRSLLVPTAGIVVLLVACSALTAVLNARLHFAWPQATAVIPTLAIVAVLMVWGKAGGARALVLGMLAGALLQCLVLALMLRRSGHRFAVPAETGTKTQEHTRLWPFALPVIAIGLLSQINVYVDRSMAANLASGAVAILAWSGTMRDFFAGTLIGGFLSVMLPHFAQQSAQQQYEQMRDTCQIMLRQGAMLVLPLSAAVAISVPQVLAHVELGSLDRADSATIGLCFAAYAWGFYADLASNTLYTALLAMGRVRPLLWLALVASFLPNILFNLLLMRYWGAVGLAASTTLVGYCTLSANYLVLRRALKLTEGGKTLRSIITAASVTLLSAALGHQAAHLWDTASTGAATGVAAAVTSALVCITVYLAVMLYLPGNDDLRSTLARVMPFVRRGS